MKKQINKNRNSLYCRLRLFFDPIMSYVLISISLILISLFSFLLSYFEVFGRSRDYYRYTFFFDLIRTNWLEIFNITRFEPGFTALTLSLAFFQASNVAVYSTVVAGVMCFKGMLISLVSGRPMIYIFVLIFYFSRYFPQYELTQLRAGISQAFLLLAMIFVCDDKKKYGVIACFAALLFHLSSLLAIPILFIRTKQLFVVVLIGLAVFFGTSLFINSLNEYLRDHIYILQVYNHFGFGTSVRPFSATILLDCGMIIIGALIWGGISITMRHVLLMEIVGIAIFYGAIDYPLISQRCRELFTIFWILFVAQGLQLCSVVKFVSILFIFCSIILYCYIFIYSGSFSVVI